MLSIISILTPLDPHSPIMIASLLPFIFVFIILNHCKGNKALPLIGFILMFHSELGEDPAVCVCVCVCVCNSLLVFRSHHGVTRRHYTSAKR